MAILIYITQFRFALLFLVSEWKWMTRKTAPGSFLCVWSGNGLVGTCGHVWKGRSKEGTDRARRYWHGDTVLVLTQTFDHLTLVG